MKDYQREIRRIRSEITRLGLDVLNFSAIEYLLRLIAWIGEARE